MVQINYNPIERKQNEETLDHIITQRHSLLYLGFCISSISWIIRWSFKLTLRKTEVELQAVTSTYLTIR